MLFITPSYGSYKSTVSAISKRENNRQLKGSFTNTEFGISSGTGYKLSDAMSAEISFEQINDTNVIGTALKYYF